ncbi:MAG: SUF system NifU family Fe-S cluster assembly protein [candidate division Zixibacteria bacterium CG_4_9_14_3_um_filter_46_8]|nr:MAG: SUF system NifU family Fe-S cluster assembly protein [candidate division Zixibacteria bacterium CG_4_9_14_3_um_filter_46_8]
MSEALDALYRDILMDHYRNPRGKRKLLNPEIHNHGENPLCGDELEMEIKIDGDRVADIYVSCAGCAVSVSSGSMLAEIIKGKSLAEVKRIARAVKAMLTGGEVIDEIELGDLEVLEGVKKFPVRVKCALLSWATLVNSLESYEHGLETKVSSTE